MTTQSVPADNTVNSAADQIDVSSVSSDVSRAISTSQMANLAKMLFLNGEVPAEAFGKVISVTSPVAGEGVSTVSALLAKELVGTYQQRTLLVSTSVLNKLMPDHIGKLSSAWSRNSINGYWQGSEELQDKNARNGPWLVNRAFCLEVMQTIRAEFDAIVIDSGPVITTGDVANLAPVVDGFLIVVRSGGSTRDQLQQAVRVLQLIGGTIKGTCFNRRTYPIPERIYRFLKR